jgi:4-hydroxy-tetrahydrodipicolinate synthase
MSTHELEVLTATPVPFSDDGSLLMDTYEAMLTRVAPHTEGVFVNGTTGEFPALEDRERSDLLEAAVAVFGASQVVAHIGAPSARQVLRHAEAAAGMGITRMAALTPYYLPCDFAQVHELYTTITQAFPEAAVFVYLFPERSGIDVPPEELAELTAIDGVAGAKLSGRPNDQFERYVELAAPGSRVYSGDDGSYPRVAAAGGAGVVSGVSSAFPEVFGQLTKALMSDVQDKDAIQAAQAQVVPAVRAAGPTITRLKYALSARYGEKWGTRMPLPAVGEEARTLIDSLLPGGLNGDRETGRQRRPAPDHQ